MDVVLSRESVRSGASRSLLKVYFLRLRGLSSPTPPREAVDGEPRRGLIGDPLTLAGVASRSKRLIKDARSLVAASRIDNTPANHHRESGAA